MNNRRFERLSNYNARPGTKEQGITEAAFHCSTKVRAELGLARPNRENSETVIQNYKHLSH